MESVGKLLKGVTALIYLVPGIALFSNFIYPVNISKAFLIGLCETLGAVIILLAFINRKYIQSKSKKVIGIFAGICVLAIASLLISLAFFYAGKISNTYNNEKVLLPVSCNEPLCRNYEEAKKAGKEIAAYIGKDELIERINFCCKKEMLQSEIKFDVLVILLFNIVILLFIVLALYYDQPVQKTQ